MKMEFTYEDFSEHYAGNDSWLPKGPLEPWKCIDQVKFPVSDEDINANIQKTMEALEKRMGGEYFSKFSRVQTLSQSYGKMVFPAYNMLFLDVVCEDWLALVDFHKGFGRDHSVHQPLTAYIVSKLLGGGKADAGFEIGGRSILEKALDAISGDACQYLRDRLAYYEPDSPLIHDHRDLWRKVFYQTAIITALYHDLGYPWQFIERMHSFLKDDIMLCGRLKYSAEQINPIVQNYIDVHQDELVFRPFYNYGKDGRTKDTINGRLFEKYLHESHGVPGALAYWAYNQEYYTEEDVHTAGLIKFCQEWSCMAILMHDMQKAYAQAGGDFAKLDFETDPLSFIIALADTLEDFNRPNAKIIETDEGCKIKYLFPSLAVKLEEDGGNAKILYKIVPEEIAMQEKFKSEDQEKLFNQPEGYFHLGSVGLRSLKIDCE